MKAIIVTDQAAGTAGMKLVERQRRSMSEPACYTLQIDVAHRFLRQTWHEPVTAGALITLWTELTADPRGLAEFDTLSTSGRRAGTHHQRRRHAG